MTNRRWRPVVFEPESYQGMQRGINQMANAIRPTLGPLPRAVAVAHPLAHRTPELLDNGGTIARRLIELPDRDADMGAMFMRHVVRHVHDDVGDGTATAAVLLQAVYNQGIRYIAAGGNPMRLRRFLEEGTRLILAQLNGMVSHLRGKANLARIAESICHDPPLAGLIGEIFDIIGEHGRLEVKVGPSRELDREYIEGMYWPGEILSREMITDYQNVRTSLENAVILASNWHFEEPESLVPVLQAAKATGAPGLMIIADKISDKAIAVLLANSKPDQFRAIAVKAPGIGPTKQAEALQDIVMLAGGVLFLRGAGQSNLNGLPPQALGRARKVWADRTSFGVIGGRGNPRQIRQHIAGLRTAYRRAGDVEARQTLQERLGKLIGGSATLKIGGATNAEIVARQAIAEQTCDAMRGAIIEGVLPGGGIALLDCRPPLEQKLAASTDTDEQAACRILIDALAEPLRTIVGNAGYDQGQVMALINQAGPGHGFDVINGEVINLEAAGLYDSARVVKRAVQSAIASAALALTTEVLVHHKKPAMEAAQGPGAR